MERIRLGANATNTGANEWIRTILGSQRYTTAKVALIFSQQINAARILNLGGIFATDVCAYAVMSNHHHVVLHVNKSEHSLERRGGMRGLAPSVQRRGAHAKVPALRGLSDVELEAVADKLALWRERLCDISWFMRARNEPIADKPKPKTSAQGDFGNPALPPRRCLTRRLWLPVWHTQT